MRRTKPYAQERVDRWAYGFVACSLLLVIYTTLFPFDFFFDTGSSLAEIVSRFDLRYAMPGASRDLFRNVLLFVPLGFGFSGLIKKRLLKWITMLLAILIASFTLSFIAEALQLFLPGREPSLADVLANGVGALMGFLIFRLWGGEILGFTAKIFEKIEIYLSVNKVITIFVGYATLAVLVSIYLQSATGLSNWDQTFPLILGNEWTGDRPWRGYVSELYFSDRAFSDSEVARVFAGSEPIAAIGGSTLASFPLTGKTAYDDQSGHLPNLYWRGKAPDAQEEIGVFLGPSHWLTTRSPAAYLIQKVSETSQFTLSAIVATAASEQVGPARMISISADPFQRDLTLGQEGSDLLLRLRTPVTGANGLKPELIVPNFFVDTDPHHLIVSYNGAVVQVYEDGLQHRYRFELTPEVTFFRYLLPVDVWRIRPGTANAAVYKILYYGFTFIPLTFLGAVIVRKARGRYIFRVIAVGGALILSALILETSMASVGGRVIRSENLLISLAIIIGTMLFFKVRDLHWLGGETTK